VKPTSETKSLLGIPMGTNDSSAANTEALLNFSDSPFVDDDSWAEPPRAADRRLQIAAVALGLGVVALTFFTIGAKVGKGRAATPAVGLGAGFGGRGAGGIGGIGGAGAGAGRARSLLPTIGKVTKIDESTITMIGSDGTTVIVNLAEDTSIGRRKTQRPKDISVGDEISVRGATGDDGAITATALTVGDVEPSIIPGGAGAVGAGGFGGAGAQPNIVTPGATELTPSASAPPSATELVPPSTTPTLGGLLPG
jgi:Domain of unknown function (DUF5666)